MDKPTVHFKRGLSAIIGDVGGNAYVEPIDHPNCSNTGHVRTSQIVSKSDNGDFETCNTKYVGVDHA